MERKPRDKETSFINTFQNLPRHKDLDEDCLDYGFRGLASIRWAVIDAAKSAIRNEQRTSHFKQRIVPIEKVEMEMLDEKGVRPDDSGFMEYRQYKHLSDEWKEYLADPSELGHVIVLETVQKFRTEGYGLYFVVTGPILPYDDIRLSDLRFHIGILDHEEVFELVGKYHEPLQAENLEK